MIITEKMNISKAKKVFVTGVFLAIAMCGAESVLAADAPPAVDLGSLMNQTSELKISQASAFPAGIDPTKDEKTTITYKVSDEASVKIEILDGAKSVIVILVNEEITEAETEKTTEWDGTDSSVGGGEIMPPGNYTYRVTATDQYDETNQDIVEGTVQLIYGDFLGDVDDTEYTNDVDNGTDIVTLHNAPPSNTSGTGPEALIYLVLPFLGPIVMKFRKK